MASNLLLLYTLRHLKLSQLYYQLVYRTKGKLTSRRLGPESRNVSLHSIRPLDLYIPGLDDAPVFMARFSPQQLLANQITLLNESRQFRGWNYEHASHLWNFNLHYLEFLVPLASMSRASSDTKRSIVDTDCDSDPSAVEAGRAPDPSAVDAGRAPDPSVVDVGFDYPENRDRAQHPTPESDVYKKKLNQYLDSWFQYGSQESDAVHPYTISLRIVNLLIIAESVSDRQSLYQSIYAQYHYLLRNTEKHLLGNHYLENLKAIVICSILFREEAVYRKFILLLLKELKEQIREDGLHYEFSLMYHKIILEDLIRLALTLKQAGKEESGTMISLIRRMCTALYSLEYGTDRTPLFNDAGDNVAKPAGALLGTCKKLFGIIPEKREQIAGYHKFYDLDGRISLIVDCGELGPSYMAGHAHNDCLSFELFYEGKPVFVNAGTYYYQGYLRPYFRSTKAHNTAMINGHEQSELWGEHRAGRRISKVRSRREGSILKGSYKNYLGQTHERILRLENGILIVRDLLELPGGTISSVRTKAASGHTGYESAASGHTGPGPSASGHVGLLTAESYLHLAPGLQFIKETELGNKTLKDQGYIKGKGLHMRLLSNSCSVHAKTCLYAEEFGKIQKITCLVFRWDKSVKKHTYIIDLKST